MPTLSHIIDCYIKNKKVVFITTKDISYIRNLQEIDIIKKKASDHTVIGSHRKSYLLRLIKIYYLILTTNFSQYDTIWVGFAPQLILPIFKSKFLKTNATIIEDFFISLYDTFCYDRKKFSPGSLIGKALHSLDEKTLASADYIICDTNAHGQYFIEEFYAHSEHLYTLYLQAYQSLYRPMSVTRPDYLEGKYVVLYFGSVLPLQGVDVVLEAMKQLQHNDKLFFYFIGPIKSKQLHRSKPVSDNIKYFDWLPQEELTKYINYSDLCLAGHFNASIEKAKRTIPGKAYIYQAIGKPMILGDNPANHELFSTTDNVTFVEMGNAQALADAILKLSSMP